MPHYTLFICLALFIALIWATVPFIYFADAQNYINFIETIKDANDLDFFYIDPISKIVLYIIESYTNNLEYTLAVSTVLIGAIFYISLLWFSNYLTNFVWQRLLLYTALYGPLLAFVTLRATPAYIAILIAVIVLGRKKYLSILLGILAIGIHVSALVPFFIILLTIAYCNFKDNLFFIFNNKIIKLLMLAGLFAFINYALINIDYLLALLTLEKYFAYTDTGGANVSPSHYLYLLFISIIYFYSLTTSKFDAYLDLYLKLSYLSYLLFFFVSPIIAFRLTIFWFPLVIFFCYIPKIFKNAFYGILSLILPLSLLIYNFLDVLKNII
jgi:EpsG family